MRPTRGVTPVNPFAVDSYNRVKRSKQQMLSVNLMQLIQGCNGRAVRWGGTRIKQPNCPGMRGCEMFKYQKHKSVDRMGN